MDRTLLKWLIRLGILLGALLLSLLIHIISRKIHGKLDEAGRSPENKRAGDFMAWGVSVLICASAAYFLVNDFNLESSIRNVLIKLVHSLALLGLTQLSYGLLPIFFKLGRKSALTLGINPLKRAAFNRVWETVLRIVVVLCGLAAILSVWNIDVSGIITGLGIGSLAVALAAQNLLSNVIGGATLMLDKPFEIGDSVVIGELGGTVEEVGWRSTRIRSYNDEVVTLPNSKLMDSSIANLSRMQQRRINLTIEVGGVEVESKIAEFCERMRSEITARPLRIVEKEPQVAIQNLRWGGYQLLLRYYIKETDFSLYLREVDEILLKSTHVMKEMGLKQVYAEVGPGQAV